MREQEREALRLLAQKGGTMPRGEFLGALTGGLPAAKSLKDQELVEFDQPEKDGGQFRLLTDKLDPATIALLLDPCEVKLINQLTASSTGLLQKDISRFLENEGIAEDDLINAREILVTLGAARNDYGNGNGRATRLKATNLSWMVQEAILTRKGEPGKH